MCPHCSQVALDQEHLGSLAMAFRGTRSEADRRKVADEYADTINRLIASGEWHEAPAMEDQLPNEWMPRSFFEFWIPHVAH